MSSVYRIRPCNDLTIDEIQNHYLWFSRRSGFNDPDDANIGAFIDNNEVLREAFEQELTPQGIETFLNKMECTGICCFTDKKPSSRMKDRFPGGKNCICIEYDKNKIESFFLNKYALANCFCEVLYFKSPIVFEQDGKYHILTQKDKDGFLYESVLGLTRTERDMEKLIKILLTRINSQYYFQNEQRIILGGRNIPSFDPNISGYQVQIPKDAFLKIHRYKDTEKEFINKLSGTSFSL